MSATRGMLRSLAQTCSGPGEVLTRLNRCWSRIFPPGDFVTLIYAILDPKDRTLKFANAGHLPPLLVQGDTTHVLVAESGLPLGLLSGEFSETEVKLRRKTRAWFSTATASPRPELRDEEFGLERLPTLVLKTQRLRESILADVRSFVNGAGLQDDATVILVRAK